MLEVLKFILIEYNTSGKISEETLKRAEKLVKEANEKELEK